MYNSNVTISKRNASTVYDRFNFTIVAVTDLSDPLPVEYEPTDFFDFYDLVFAINVTQPNWDLSTSYTFLLSLISYLQYEQDQQIVSGGGNRLFKLEEFLAAPLAIFNFAWLGEPTEGMGQSLSLVAPSYRVHIPNLSG